MPLNSMTEHSIDSQSALKKLEKSRLLSTLPSELLQSLTPFFKIKRYPQKAELTRKDSSSLEIFFLIRGKIATYSNGNLIYELRRLGDMCGDMSFITDKKFFSKEVAETPVELLSLNITEVINDENNATDNVKWALYQLFATMLVDKLTMCCSKANEQQTIANKLEKLKELLSETRLKLKASNKVKQDFLSNISHEIRTPMHGVLGMTSLLLNTELSDQQKEFVQTIQKSATAFLDVINRILDFSEIGSGELELQDGPFDVRKVVENVVKELDPTANGSDLVINTSISSQTPRVLKGDAVRVHQVLVNLLSNAIKFTEKGKIELLVDVISQYDNLVRLKFSVKDTGIGISKEDKELLFKSFSQVDTSLTRKYGGIGLGLVISKQLIEAMGGEIDFESKRGEGSTFWFSLDFEIQQDRRIKTESGLPQNRKYTRQSDKVVLLHPKEKRNYNVLLVSNNKIDQLIVQLMLEKLGYSIRVLNSVDKANDYIVSNRVDIALVDINITKIAKWDSSQNRGEHVLDNTDKGFPVIALTSHVLDNKRANCLQNGMNDYLSKPISIEDLDIVLQRWISIRKDGNINQQMQGNKDHIACVDLNVTDRLQREIGEINALISLFISEIPGKIQSIKCAISSGNCSELEQAAHTLKSNCITFGAMLMADICYELESIGHNGTTEGAQNLLSILENQSHDVTVFLQNYFQIERS